MGDKPISGSSQPASTPQPPPVYTAPPISLILTIVLIVFFFISFFSIYFCKCFLETVLQAWHLQRTSSGNRLVRSLSSNPTNALPGLNPKIIQSFPSFPYSLVKNLKTEKTCCLECAICLSEFADDDVLRLLTTCCHVFHQECIDLWLGLHKTCPVCRHELETCENEIPTENEIVPLRDEMIINIIRVHEDDDGGQDRSNDGVVGSDRSIGSRVVVEEMFPKSHSTGHSIVRNKTKEDQDRYTLRLPENVDIRVVGTGKGP